MNPDQASNNGNSSESATITINSPVINSFPRIYSSTHSPTIETLRQTIAASVHNSRNTYYPGLDANDNPSGSKNNSSRHLNSSNHHFLMNNMSNGNGNAPNADQDIEAGQGPEYFMISKSEFLGLTGGIEILLRMVSNPDSMKSSFDRSITLTYP